jgi:universal stress protein E
MKRFTNILVSLDSRLDFQPALQLAELLTKNNQAELTLVDVQRAFSWPMRLVLRDYENVKRLEIETKRERLEALAQPIRSNGLEVAIRVPCGSTSIEVIREVLRAKHDLVIRVSKGTDSHREDFFGSTTMRLL